MINRILGTTTWKEVGDKFKSPVVVFALLLTVVNIVRTEFGWVFDISWLESVIKILLYGVVNGFAILNTPENETGL